MARYTGKIKLVILDLAGTVCDGPQDLRQLFPNDDLKGVKVPMICFEKVFAKRGMNVDWATIRKPMGLFKGEHLRELFNDQVVTNEFKRATGREWTEGDIEEMFREFRAIVPDIVTMDELVKPIEGVKECMDQLRSAGIKLGCDTGYPIEACTVVYKALEEKHGVRFDVVADSENVRGRPTPFLVFDCMNKANVYPPEAVVKADDVKAGIAEGNNAGAWTVSLFATGEHNRQDHLELKPDFLIPSVKELPEIVFDRIDPKLAKGELPGQAGSQG